jgi:hypothetical protein
MAQKDPIFEVCDVVRECSFALHKFLRHGHKRKIYENGLVGRLRRSGVDVEQQPFELKAVTTILNEHVAQLLCYLRASRKELGLLINFGAPVLQIKKYALSTDLDSQS